MTLLMTHPATEDRIQRLKALAEKAVAEVAEAPTLSPST
jgi:heat shock protein HtpX